MENFRLCNAVNDLVGPPEALETEAGAVGASAKQRRPIRVLANDREAGGGVVTAWRQMADVEVEVCRLKLGDYETDGRCVFERKTMTDLAASLADGRLFAQAHRLANSGALTALVLEGRGSDLAQSRMRREALLGAMVSLTLVFALPVLRSHDPEETARILVYAAGQLRRHETNVSLFRGNRPRTKRRTQLRILQSLPGIGPVRAQRLMDHFGSVEAVMTASEGQLQAVVGLGEEVARKIRWALSA